MFFSLPLILALGQVIGSVTASNIVEFSPNIKNIYTTNVKSDARVSRIKSMTKMTPLDSARMFIKSKLGFNSDAYIVKNSYTSDHNKVTHIYLRQIMDGKEIFNADININVSKEGKIISYGDSFFRLDESKRNIKPRTIEFPNNFVPATEAMESLMEYFNITKHGPVIVYARDYDGNSGLQLRNVPGAQQDVRAVQGWIQLENGTLEPVWDFKVGLESDYYHSHVSVNNKKPVSIINWVSNFSYNVLPFGINDLSEGKRRLIQAPHNGNASPMGWHNDMVTRITDTSGNNVYVVKVSRKDPMELDPSSRVKGDKFEKFDFPLDETKYPESYKDAAITNLFYMNNMMHDLFFLYGFDRKAGNFEELNFEEGKGGDAIIAHGQDASDFNNAKFFAPPDGERGSMSMFLFNQTNPNRDGDFDNGVIIHEYTHGLSTRLTGGPANSDCLKGGEPGGLGEGWGDFIATMIRMNSTTSSKDEFAIGKYLTNEDTLRRFLFSTSMETNPLEFAFVGYIENQYVHNSGEIWASILFDVYWSLAEKLPIADDWFKSAADPKKYANTLLLQLIIDGMKLQPCKPNFLDARDAIIQAERIYTEGRYTCALWRGFARRGMGIDAKFFPNEMYDNHENSFKIPYYC